MTEIIKIEVFLNKMIIRNPYFIRLITVVTGIVFLNMSFILWEISESNLDNQNNAVVEYWVEFLTGSEYEEDKDTGGESSPETHYDLKYFNHFTNLDHKNVAFRSTWMKFAQSFTTLSSYHEVFSPPPENQK